MIYVMSDIHGNKDAFDSILKKINLSENDELYILGDIIDRNPYGIELIQRIMNMPNVHMILGNHEYMMMDALGFPYEPDGCTNDASIEELRAQWFMNGGDITNDAWEKLSESEQESIKEYLLNLPLGYDVNIDGRLFKLVHAFPVEIFDHLKEEYPNEFPESRAYFSVWERDMISLLSAAEEFTTVFGHTPTCHLTGDEMPMKIYHNNGIIGIDCGAAYRKAVNNKLCRLACLRLDDMKEFYSN